MRGRWDVILGVAGSLTLVLSVLLIWLMVNEPVALAEVVTADDYAAFTVALGRALGAVLQTVMAFV